MGFISESEKLEDDIVYGLLDDFSGSFKAFNRYVRYPMSLYIKVYICSHKG